MGSLSEVLGLASAASGRGEGAESSVDGLPDEHVENGVVKVAGVPVASLELAEFLVDPVDHRGVEGEDGPVLEVVHAHVGVHDEAYEHRGLAQTEHETEIVCVATGRTLWRGNATNCRLVRRRWLSLLWVGICLVVTLQTVVVVVTTVLIHLHCQ